MPVSNQEYQMLDVDSIDLILDKNEYPYRCCVGSFHD